MFVLRDRKKAASVGRQWRQQQEREGQQQGGGGREGGGVRRLGTQSRSLTNTVQAQGKKKK